MKQEDNTNRVFIKLQKAIFSHSLTPIEIAVYVHIVHQTEIGNKYLSLSTLTEICKLSKPTLIKTINTLVDRCLIDREHMTDSRGGNLPSRYAVEFITPYDEWRKSPDYDEWKISLDLEV